jgi:hypothetical protein
MSGGRRYYRLLSPTERERTQEVMPTLIRAGCISAVWVPP